MALLTTNDNSNSELNQTFHFPSSKKALIVFTKNPELGKVKTRLAASVGDKTALGIYKFLIQHIAAVSEKVIADKYIFYSENIELNDSWDDSIFRKMLQQQGDLGTKMKIAFDQLFKMGYQKVVIVGSDIYELTTQDIKDAFLALETDNVVIGPSKDGGYYLLGMKQLKNELFENKAWGTDTVFEDTMSDLKNEKVHLLPYKSDVDVFDDIKDIEIFQQFLKN